MRRRDRTGRRLVVPGLLVVAMAVFAAPARDLCAQTEQPVWAFSAGSGTAVAQGVVLSGSIGLTVAGVSSQSQSAQGAGFWHATRDRLVIVSIEEEEGVLDIPTVYALDQNYPNPFNPTTQIRFAVPEKAVMSLLVFNVLGQLVAELVHAEYNPGYYTLNWDGRDSAGNALPSGLYLYSLQAENYTRTRKMVLQK